MHTKEQPEDPYSGIRMGTSDYRKVVLSMLAAGLATFNALYCTQAMLPTLTAEFGITPTQSALTVSAATGMLALCIVPASILSERFGRGRVLIISAVSAVLLGFVLPFVPSAEVLIILRGLQGALLAGVPAVAMTWLSEEMDQRDLPRAMGIYVAGTTVGGLTGRLIPAGVLEVGSWRWALAAGALTALICALIIVFTLPKQRRFTPKKLRLSSELQAMAGHWRNPRLAMLFITAFLAMGSFVSVYNFLGFRMIDTFGLSAGLVGAIFIMYLSGTWSSARAGVLTQRFGKGPVMVSMAIAMIIGLALLIPDILGVSIAGLFLFTAAFFAVHSTASSWIGSVATQHRAEASSMYLFCYYVGSSLVGWASGFVFTDASWPVFIAWLAVLLTMTLGIAIMLARSEKSSA